MKRTLNKSIRDEKGQALILALILLLIGGLIIAPLLGYMSTGLIVGQVHEKRMNELYAADAGIEDALWKIKNDQVLAEYFLTVNEKDVEVDVVLEEDVEGFFEALLNENYSGVHSDWTALEEIVGAGTYTITMTYNGNSDKKFITGIGAWLEGDYNIKYDNGNPVYSGITDDYPNHTFQVVSYKGGTAFIWEWTGENRPEFGTESGVFTRWLTFEFAPVEVPSFHFSWVVTGSSDIGIVTSGYTLEIWKATATATTDSTTGKQTRVVAYVFRQGEGAPYPVNIITWDISLQ